jgi:undecaprenyl-diphosphatase
MNLIYSVLLGIVQGLTEFLPVSSSAHLVIVQNLFGIKDPQIFFDIVLHLGTLCAVVLYFYKDIIYILKSLIDVRSEGFRFAVLLFMSIIPTAIGGFLLKDFFESLFTSPLASATLLIVTGIVLFITRFKKKTTKDISSISILDAVIIGIAQTCAIAPGLSRSGMTVSAGIFRGIDRKLCAKYSLLLSIPAILGALLSEIGDVSNISAADIFNYFVGFGISLAVGYIAIGILVKVLERARFYMFAYYCWILGICFLLYFNILG